SLGASYQTNAPVYRLHLGRRSRSIRGLPPTLRAQRAGFHHRLANYLYPRQPSALMVIKTNRLSSVRRSLHRCYMCITIPILSQCALHRNSDSINSLRAKILRYSPSAQSITATITLPASAPLTPLPHPPPPPPPPL